MVLLEYVQKLDLQEFAPVEIVHVHRGPLMGYFSGVDENWVHIFRDGHTARIGRADPYPLEDVLSINKLVKLPAPAEEPNVVECSDIQEW